MAYFSGDFTGTFWTILDGDYYVSTFGSDIEGEGDGSPQKPFLTIGRAFKEASDGDKIIIGPDEYVLEITEEGTASPDQFGSEPPVKAVSDIPIDINAYGLSPVDGVSIVAGERVLLIAQNDPAENGIYESSIGIWQRASNYNSASNIYKGKLIPVIKGEKYANTIFQNNTVPNITLGTTPLSFVQITSDAETAIAGAESYTYNQLKQLVLNNELIPGAMYELSDFQTKYNLRYSTELKDESPVEPLILIASSEDTFYKNAISRQYDADIIHFDFNDDICENGSEPRKGKITYREDTIKKLSAYYDWRNIKFRRYNVTGIAYNSVSKVNDVTFDSGLADNGTSKSLLTGYKEYYLEFSELTHSADPNLVLSSEAKLLKKPGGISLAQNELQSLIPEGKALVYYSPFYDCYIIFNNSYENESVKGYNYWFSSSNGNLGHNTKILIDQNDYVDLYTFGNLSDGGNLYDIQIGKWQYFNNIVFPKNSGNNKHIHIKDNSYDSTYSNNTLTSIEIGEDSHSNLVTSDLSWSKIDNEFVRNLITKQLLRYLQTRGEFYNNSIFGQGTYYYLNFQCFSHDCTYRLFPSGGSDGQTIITGPVVSSVINADNFAFTSVYGNFANKTTEKGINWATGHITFNNSGAPIHFNAGFDNKITNVGVANYSDDFSDEFTDRSLVDKGYSDNQIGGRPVNSNISDPQSANDGQVLAWNDANQEYELKDGGSGGGGGNNLEDVLNNGGVSDRSHDGTFSSGLEMILRNQSNLDEYSRMAQRFNGFDIRASNEITGDFNTFNIYPDSARWFRNTVSQGTAGDITLSTYGIEFRNSIGQDHQYFRMRQAGITIVDDINDKGIEYDSDYSDNYSNRSLVDKEYVDKRTGNNIEYHSANFGINRFDLGKTFECDGTITVTLGSNIPLDFKCKIVNIGTGTITIEGSTGVTLNGKGPMLLSQWDRAEVYNNALNSFRLIGDLSNI